MSVKYCNEFKFDLYKKKNSDEQKGKLNVSIF